MARPLRCRSAHDYRHLIRRWRKIARATGLRVERYGEAGGYGLHVVRSGREKDGISLYFSAGIHGDEAGATEGLVTWAEKNPEVLQAANVLIFPCLNPWGLVSNCRLDADGRDLNRLYHDDSVVQIAAQKRLLGRRRFDLAINLHEDYDARGFYLYEVPGPRPYWGERFTRVVSRHLPIEDSARIEGRAARDGIVRRAIKTDLMPTWPEAFVLHFAHCDRVFTVETPSEFHLDDRVAAHVAVLQEGVRLAERARKATPTGKK